MTGSDVPTLYLFLSIIVLICLSAYFSGTETAMMALNRYRLRHMVKRKHAGARKADRMLKRPDRLLGVILVGNNLVNFTAATLATIIGYNLLGDTGVLLQNRGSFFSLDPGHHNRLEPGKRTFHTLIPAMVLREDSSEIMNIMGEAITDVALGEERYAAAMQRARADGQANLDLLDDFIRACPELA